jgi:hypothetical protein
LPTVFVGPDGACLGLGLDAVLRGDPTYPRVAWLDLPESRGPAHTFDVVWPHGYRARFSPGLEILDERGRIVLRGGDKVTGACATAGDELLLIPPFE